MPSIRESSLVNFRALRNETSPDRRGELLKNVTELLGLVADQSGQNLLDVYDSVMVRLAEMVDAKARAEIAAQLAQLRRAPSGIVRKLALDDIEIAQPLLVCSPVLTDDDLIGIAEIRGSAHRRAIATRPGLGETVTRMLVRRGDDAVRRMLAGNVTAKLSGESLRRLLDQSRHDTEMRELLAARPATPGSVRKALAELPGEDLSHGTSAGGRRRRNGRRIAAT